MRRFVLIVLTLLVFQGLYSQENSSLERVRKDFQAISGEEDIEELLKLKVDREDPHAPVIEAYQAAGTCRMAEFVFSPIKKLKYFHEGRDTLERLIESEKTVENVYCRLLVQLNVPKILNYHQEIESDIGFLQEELPKAKIDPDYKSIMINNLVTLAENDELKKSLLGIDLGGKGNKS